MTPQRKLITVAPKKKVWSHQDELQALVGKVITVGFVNGVARECTLIQADPFTVKLRFDLDGEQSDLTYFKHAIAMFGVMPKVGA